MHTLDFYLAGGTALAIYYQHRLSVDLNWFTQNPIGDSLLLASKLQDKLALTVTDVGPGTLHALIDQVSLSFQAYRYPLLKPVVISPDFDCPMSSLDDIACIKLSNHCAARFEEGFYRCIQLSTTLPFLARSLGYVPEKVWR